MTSLAVEIEGTKNVALMRKLSKIDTNQSAMGKVVPTINAVNRLEVPLSEVMMKEIQMDELEGHKNNNQDEDEGAYS